MSSPKITWLIKENKEYIQDTDHYFGSINPQDTLELEIQVWNNRYGKVSTDSIENARLVIYFDSIEDSTLLNYCSVNINDSGFNKLDLEINRATIEIGKLSGEFNNGINNENNRNNYKNLIVRFKDFPRNMKKGMKNMFLDIEIN